MADFKGSKTQENLKEAFAGESQANRRYLYFAQKADVEGYPDVAALFRSVAEGETGHAFGHFDFLAQVGDPVTDVPVGSTEDNLKSAVTGETYEYSEMYPGFAKHRPRRAASTRSPSGWRRWPGPRRATPVASPRASTLCPERQTYASFRFRVTVSPVTARPGDHRRTSRLIDPDQPLGSTSSAPGRDGESTRAIDCFCRPARSRWHPRGEPLRHGQVDPRRHRRPPCL